MAWGWQTFSRCWSTSLLGLCFDCGDNDQARNSGHCRITASPRSSAESHDRVGPPVFSHTDPVVLTEYFLELQHIRQCANNELLSFEPAGDVEPHPK